MADIDESVIRLFPQTREAVFGGFMSDTNKFAERFEESGYSEEEFKQLEQLYSGTMGKINAGEIIKGRVVHIGDSNVAVDIGFKSEGNVSVTEFPKIKELKIGDEIEVFLESIEDKDGQLVLSRKRADFMRIWERVVKSFETGEVT